MKHVLLVLAFFNVACLAEDLPRSFDLRKTNGKNFVSSVKSQSGGTCWTHATMAALESNLLMTNVWALSGEKGEADLAEYHLDWWNGFNQHRNHDTFPELNGLTVHQGGDYVVAAAYLSRGGAMRDSDGQSYSSPPKESDSKFHAFYPRDIVWLTAGNNLENLPAIKKTILENGAMGTALAWNSSFYSSSSNSFYQDPDNTQDANHAVTIVGWDDDKKTQAPKPGAWLIKNSWGPSWGKSGYFWISYYDKVAGHHAEMGAVSFQNVVRWDYHHAYSYDLHGWRDTVKEASEAFNSFTALDDEDVRSLSFYTTEDGASFKVMIYKSFNGRDLQDPLSLPLNGQFANRGFHTVDLLMPVPLRRGEKFYVYYQSSRGGMAFDRTSDVPVLLGSKERVTVKSTANAGESYYRSDGKWRDVTLDNDTANFCIKALTDKI